MQHHHLSRGPNGSEASEQPTVYTFTLLFKTAAADELNSSYGVSRVYSQQCGYVLTDAQSAQSNMRQLLKSLRTSELDLQAGKARYTLAMPRFRKGDFLTLEQP